MNGSEGRPPVRWESACVAAKRQDLNRFPPILEQRRRTDTRQQLASAGEATPPCTASACPGTAPMPRLNASVLFDRERISITSAYLGLGRCMLIGSSACRLFNFAQACRRF